ncbi:ly6 PLAUR domain-containing 6 [Pelobates cultripes]|uniref:Ly6 PLAUR domain-containing 6 n=1 Tax=Pelobates cultripes TaxID=61616 RepID=A0AAD1WCE1_PELCU|nr:ly6 PLAUR domain-containing 6 [Pelobates cultripes]
METWPVVAWILLIAGWCDTVQARDFTAQDIIYLYPSTTPYPGGFKCFTCENARDNFECNRWAPDLYCPRDSRYCYTQHIMDSSGESVLVTKRCASLEHCREAGCQETKHRGEKICTTCCEGNICNLPLPRNETDAFFSPSPLNNSERHSIHSLTLLLPVYILWLLLT